MLVRPILMQEARERGQDHGVHETVVSSAVETTFQRVYPHHVTAGEGNGKNGKQSKSWPKSADIGKSHESKRQGEGTFKGKSTGSKSAKGPHKGSHSKIGVSALI